MKPNFLWLDKSGWTGDGTFSNPYGLNFNQTPSNAYATGNLIWTLLKPTTGAFTVEVWAKILATSPDNAGLVVMHGYTGTSPRGWHLRVSGGKALFYRYVSTDQTLLSTVNINDGTLKHIVAIYNGSGNAYIYINGQFDNAVSGWNTGAIAYTNVYPLYIGAWNVSSLVYLQGTIYAVRFYLRELGPSEILQNYNAGVVDNMVGFQVSNDAKQDLLNYIKSNWKSVEILSNTGQTLARLDVDDNLRKWYIYQNKIVLVCKIKGSELAGSYPKIVSGVRVYKDGTSSTPLCTGYLNSTVFMSDTDQKEVDFLVRIK